MAAAATALEEVGNERAAVEAGRAELDAKRGEVEAELHQLKEQRTAAGRTANDDGLLAEWTARLRRKEEELERHALERGDECKQPHLRLLVAAAVRLESSSGTAPDA
eukprot:gene11026-6587_t